LGSDVRGHRRSDNGSETSVNLVPRTQGNIESINATIDDATGGVTGMRWNYRNGGWLR